MLFCWQEVIVYKHSEHTVHQGQIFNFIFVFCFGVGNKTHGLAHARHSLYNCAMH